MTDKMTYAAFESRYRERHYIGSGGFARVYKVFDHAKNGYVALKIAQVNPDWTKFTLQREVELVNKLDTHNNIARYDSCYRFNTGMAGEMDFAILKFYEEGNLEQFLKKMPDLSLEEQHRIIKGILRGVGFLHRNGIIHRDMKSQNILINREDGVWTPKITDFGLARQFGGNHTMTNSSIGLSYAYAAPEQIQGMDIYQNVDLWSVGVIMFRILNGDLPFLNDRGGNSQGAQSQLELSRKILSLELPAALEQIAEPYRTMIRRCLVLDPKDRVQTAEELMDILEPSGSAIEQGATDAFSNFRPVDPSGDVAEPLGDKGRPSVPSIPPLPVYGEETEMVTPPSPAYRVPSPPPPIPVTPLLPPTPPLPFYESEETSYPVPQDNPTIFTPAPPPEPTPPTVALSPEPFSLRGGTRRRRSWIPAAFVVLVLVGLIGAVGFFWDDLTAGFSPEADDRAKMNIGFVPTPEFDGLANQLERAKVRPDDLKKILPDILEAIRDNLDDYKPLYLAAKCHFYQKEDVKGLDYLKKALDVAEKKGTGQRLQRELERDLAAGGDRGLQRARARMGEEWGDL